MKLGRKKTGGKYIKRRKKKKYEKVVQKIPVKLGEERKKKKKTRGGSTKNTLLKGKFVNVLNKGKVEIKNVLETPSNRFLARQNIITKGTVVDTELGKVKIKNRPSQEGLINGILLE